MPAASLVHHSNDFFLCFCVSRFFFFLLFNFSLSLSLYVLVSLVFSVLSIEWEHAHNYGWACMWLCVHFWCSACMHRTWKREIKKSMTDYHLHLWRIVQKQLWKGNCRSLDKLKKNHVTGTLNSKHWHLYTYSNPSTLAMFISLQSIFTIRLFKGRNSFVFLLYT